MKKIKRIIAAFLVVLSLFSVISFSAVAVAKPKKPELFTASEVTASSVTLTWMPAENASGYRIYAYYDGKWKTVKDTSSTSVTVTGLVASKTYIFAIKGARSFSGTVYLSNDYSQVKIKTKGLVATTLSGKSELNSVQLSWDKVPGASGYAVYQYINGNWQRVGVLKPNKNYATVKDLKGSTTYAFAVRAYTVGDGDPRQGPASNILKIKTLDPNKVKVVCAGVTDSALKLKWNRAGSATGYRIYAYLGGQWKDVKTIMDGTVLTHTFKNLVSDTDYYFCVRAFRKSGSTVTWYEPSDICKVTTNPGAKDIYVYRVDELREIFSGHSYTFSYKSYNSKYGYIPVSLAKNGDEYYLNSRVNEMPYTLINNDQGAYIVLDESETYLKVPSVANALVDLSSTANSLLPGTDWSAKASVVTFNSQKVVCETYTNPSKTKAVKFYFKAGKFIAIDEVGLSGLEERAFIIALKNTSSQDLFEIPEGYTRIFYGTIENIEQILN